MYVDFIYDVRYYLPILTFIIFVSLLFDKESRDSALVLVSICIIFYLMPDLDETQSKEAYIKDFLNATYLTISYNVAAMLALMYRYDKLSKTHALLFACVIFLHVVVSFKVINGFTWWNYYFVERYNEILILIALLQIGASKDGIIRIYNRIKRHHSRDRGFDSIYHSEAQRTQTRKEEKRA